MNSHFAWQTQPMVYKSYPMKTAEVPSNLNQILLRAYLLRTQPERPHRLAVINEAMIFFHRYLLLMPTLARFEIELYSRIEKGVSVSAMDLSSLYADLLAPAYGDGVVFEKDKIGAEWASFIHLYSPFYVYKYTIGISAAYAIAERFLDGDPTASSDYIRFLKTGNSLYPSEALKIAGADITNRSTIDIAFQSMTKLLDELDTLIYRISVKIGLPESPRHFFPAVSWRGRQPPR